MTDEPQKQNGSSEEELHAKAEAIVKKAEAQEVKPKGGRKVKAKAKAEKPDGPPPNVVKLTPKSAKVAQGAATFAPSPPESRGKSETAPDPFDPAQFRYDPKNTKGLVAKVWTEGQIPIRKPNDQEWFQVRPGKDWQLEAAVLLLKHDKKYRLIAPQIAPAVREAKIVTLRCCVTIEGNPILWPVPMPGPDGRDYQYWESARAIATEAETQWIRMTSNQDVGCYNSIRATMDYGPPKHPELPFRDWLRLAFGKTGTITELDHPDLKRLRGEG